MKLAPYSTKTVPYSFSKVIHASQPGSRCNQTISIRWHVRIFDIPKCIPIKPQIMWFFYRRQGFSLLKPSHIRSERCSKRSSPVPGVTRRALSDGMLGFSIFPSVQGVTRFLPHGRYIQKTQHCICAIDLIV